MRVSVDVPVEYPSSLTEKYVVGEFLAESALSVLKSCTDRYDNLPTGDLATSQPTCDSNYSVSQKIPPHEDLWQFFQNGWEFFNQILHANNAFLSTLDYGLLFNYLQL